MSSTSGNGTSSTGRRQFLKSLFGLGGVLEVSAAQAKGKPSGDFYWADLTSGQVGFPTGKSAASGLPGSLMKLVAAAAVRQENLLPVNAAFDCQGILVNKTGTYSCQKAHGRLTLANALGQSCNVFFAQAAAAISPALFLEYARRFGLTEPVAGLASGLVPASAREPSQPYVLGLSADLKPQALQLLRMVALIGRRGSVPPLHSAEEPHTGNPFSLSLSDGTWDILQQGMAIAAREGTGRALDPEDRLRLALKTGTAPHGKTFQSWVAGYFPREAPRHAFCARSPAGTSRDAAVPLARSHLFATTWP